MTHRSPGQNRVDPWGRLIAVPSRGAFMGNRGCLHDAQGAIRRDYRLERWIICELEFKGRRRPLMTPDRYTELFFWDEATALAAGHRPCAECRRGRYNEFRDVWARGSGVSRGPRIGAAELDRILHGERLDAAGTKVTFQANSAALPDGTFVVSPQTGEPALIWDQHLRPWRHDGYLEAQPLKEGGTLEVLTPSSTVAALAGGYRPEVRLRQRT